MSSTPRTSAASWKGAFQIVRFNWPGYVFAVLIILIGICALWIPAIPRLLTVVGLTVAIYFSTVSVLASHWIYDLSPLADWAWIPTWLPAPLGRWVLIEAGFDSTHGQLHKRLPQGLLKTVDLYGIPGVGGASVRRARADTRGSAYNPSSALPEGEGVCETILAIFALHEIHRPRMREDFFRALARNLVPGGQLIVVEHLRDWKNLMVFGPGFFHFLPEREWLRCADHAGLRLEKKLALTPFVRAFAWRKS